MSGFITLRAVIYHGTSKLMIGNNSATVVKILCKLRLGYKAGVCLGSKLKYTYLAQYCLISFSLPWLLLFCCTVQISDSCLG